MKAAIKLKQGGEGASADRGGADVADADAGGGGAGEVGGGGGGDGGGGEGGEGGERGGEAAVAPAKAAGKAKVKRAGKAKPSKEDKAAAMAARMAALSLKEAGGVLCACDDLPFFQRSGKYATKRKNMSMDIRIGLVLSLAASHPISPSPSLAVSRRLLPPSLHASLHRDAQPPGRNRTETVAQRVPSPFGDPRCGGGAVGAPARLPTREGVTYQEG